VSGASYQRAMTAIFHDMMGDIVDVDDILVRFLRERTKERRILLALKARLTSGLRFHRRRVGKVTAKHAVTSKPSLRSLQGRIQPLRRTTFTQFSLSGLVSTRKTLPISRCISCQRPCCRLLSLRDHFSCMCQPPTRRLGLFWHSF
jgi:hypothetical protein